VSGRSTADRRLGIVGAGKIGTAIARAAVAGGYDVVISGSGVAERIELIVDVLAPGAHAVTTDAVVRHADLIVLAVPMHRFRELPGDLFAGKILVDAMNYWAEVDGIDEELATAPTGTSVVVQRHFSSSRVVKSLNHLGYFKFEQGRRLRGAPGRLAMAAAGDDPVAVASVMQLIDRLGFDAVNVGSLTAGLALQPGGPVFGISHRHDELSNLLRPEAARGQANGTDCAPRFFGAPPAGRPVTPRVVHASELARTPEHFGGHSHDARVGP
jgi:predicted dinucleotide-binding enzyme